jgi:hypothetical protein
MSFDFFVTPALKPIAAIRAESNRLAKKQRIESKSMISKSENKSCLFHSVHSITQQNKQLLFFLLAAEA